MFFYVFLFISVLVSQHWFEAVSRLVLILNPKNSSHLDGDNFWVSLLFRSVVLRGAARISECLLECLWGHYVGEFDNDWSLEKRWS